MTKHYNARSYQTLGLESVYKKRFPVRHPTPYPLTPATL